MADSSKSAAVRILGVDPGLRRTGWGVIAAEGTRLSFVACGTVVSDERLTLAERLRQLHVGLTEVLAAWSSDEVAVEETFVNKDAQATLKLGHARGVALLVPALAGLPVAEYPANLIKKTVVGAGHAEKRQIQAMVRVLLPKADPPSDDAADALAVAITHAHFRKAARWKAALAG
jgi:crossover junction endodeoxyribonuclease RuvC